MLATNEKIDYFKENGILHIFRKNSRNFIYHRDGNKTYEIGNNIYVELKTNAAADINELDEINLFLKEIKTATIEKIKFLSLYINKSIDTLIYTYKLRDVSIRFGKCDVFFKNLDKIESIEAINNINKEFDNDDISPQFQISINELYSSDLLCVGNNVLLAGSATDFLKLYDKHPGLIENFKIIFTANEINKIDILIDKLNNVNFLIESKNLDENIEFSKYIISTLSKLDYGKINIKNIGFIYSYLLLGYAIETEIEIFHDDNFISIDNLCCNKCWAKNICWSVACYDSFGINIAEADKYIAECNFVRNFIEEVIASLYNIEYNFMKYQSGHKIN